MYLWKKIISLNLSPSLDRFYFKNTISLKYVDSKEEEMFEYDC